MATYGRYEIVKELHPGTLTTVSTAVLAGQKAGERPPFIIKSFHASLGLLDPVGQTASHDVFICFAPEDASIATAVTERMEREGLRCRLTPHEAQADGKRARKRWMTSRSA